MSTYIKQTDKGMPVYTDCPPILKEYLRNIIVVRGLSEQTANTYYVNLRLFLRFIKMKNRNIPEVQYDEIDIEDVTIKEISEVTKDDILEFILFVSKSGNKISSRSNKLSTIIGFYKYFCDTYPDLMQVNPAAKIERPKKAKKHPIYLNEDEAQLLLEASKKTAYPERDFCITTLFLNCGLRLSELTGINVNSIHENTIKILGKGNKERTIYLNSSCVYAMEKWIEVRKNLKAIKDTDALFISRNGTRLVQRSVQKIIKKELMIAGLDGKGYSPHKLRHTAATMIYKGGARLMELKEILGHEHTTTTEIYTHLNNEQLKTATENNPLNKITKENEKGDKEQ